MKEIIKGVFEVFESFVIRNKNEFYLIGNLIKGTIKEGWFVNVVVNNSLSITLRVSNIEKVEVSGQKETYNLLIVKGDDQDLNILLGLNIGNEHLNITIEGKD
ncbi:hypothetical protein [Hyunsoonleella ulvae]|uniref:hypothetical protein n=1 Tax=Hyunsoonleella ulvae TaxID=2799948 RepID=UPI0019399F91|nr:hypothetical protein [Hyunsoonleella ulvae]